MERPADTPETPNEREAAKIRRKAAEENFEFPILIDGKGENWNAWGNSMWPAVYLIDQRAYLREFWPGELKWRGNDGEKFMRERIEGLLARPGQNSWRRFRNALSFAPCRAALTSSSTQ